MTKERFFSAEPEIHRTNKIRVFFQNSFIQRRDITITAIELHKVIYKTGVQEMLYRILIASPKYTIYLLAALNSTKLMTAL